MNKKQKLFIVTSLFNGKEIAGFYFTNSAGELHKIDGINCQQNSPLSNFVDNIEFTVDGMTNIDYKDIVEVMAVYADGHCKVSNANIGRRRKSERKQVG